MIETPREPRGSRRPLPVLGRGRTAFHGQLRGYTLVEVMIVVAIVGVVAALAVYGVSRYMATSKTSEAKDKVRLISEAAEAAFHRDRTRDPNMLLPGAFTLKRTHVLCESAIWVPDDIAKVKAHKYQPETGSPTDFNTGNWTTGWACLHFTIEQPIKYRYNYSHNGGDWSGLLSGTGAEYFVAQAEGDVDGDGVVSRFMRGGTVVGDELNLTTEVWVDNPTE